MKRQEIPILPILLMLAMAVGAYWGYKNIELEEVEYEAEQSKEARTNQFLAASRLLEENGFNFGIAKDRRVFSTLDVNTTGVLWIADLTVLTNQQEADELHAWVASGGVLLTSPRNENAFDDATISGAYLEKIGLSALDDDEVAMAENLHNRTMYTGNNAIHVDLPDTTLDATDITLYSDVVPYFKNAVLNDSNARDIINTPYLVHKKIGKGYTVVYANSSMFDNDTISVDDHGYLLLWLTQPAKTKQLSIVFRLAEKPGLFNLLWNRFNVSIVLLGIVLIGFLRWASSRLGPVEHELPPIQNNLMAHLEARGEYWYRHNYTDKMTKQVQSAAIDTLLKNRGKPGMQQIGDTIDKTESIKQASELLHCSPVTAEQALFGTLKKDSAILSATRVLQKINHQKPSNRNH